MRIEQIYTGCLAEASYYVESNGEAAIIDPIRDIDEYISKAKKDKAIIKYIILTHFHADFMGGHQDLAKITHGKIIIGPTTLKTGYKAQIVEDNEILKVGNILLKILHTPGHTTESISILLFDENKNEHCIFTGDTLFIGDVGRPDLAQKVVSDLTQEKLAKMLYKSLRTKIMVLPDHVIVYPNHGAGSPCGKYMSNDTFDTLGNQKKTNYALRANQTEEEFVGELLNGLKEPPLYFPAVVLKNVNGVESINSVRSTARKALDLTAFQTILQTEKDLVVLDTREASEFVKGFIPGSINIDLDSNYAIWVGAILRNIETKILLVTPEQRAFEAIDRLARVGFDNVKGFLEGGIKTWMEAKNTIDQIPIISPSELANLHRLNSINLVDVRRESEFNSEHVIGAINEPLDYWWNSINKLDRKKTYYIYCKTGTRSSIFNSIFKREGYHNMINITQGIEEIKATKSFEMTDYVCPSTLL